MNPRPQPGPAPAPIDPQRAWRAVERRDPDFDGRFVFAVSTTGVYCRPSCPARRPLRRHVSFFPSPAAARAAGFRACRRCHPDGPLGPDPRRRIERAMAWLAAHPDDRVTLVELGRRVGLSAFHLQRTFRRLTGLSPKEYAAALRVGRLKAQLRSGASVTDAVYAAGYGSSSRVYEAAPARLGMTPAAYRRGGHGVRIRFTTAATPFGRLLVGATERGLCAVSLGDNDRALEAALRQEYPHAAIERAGGGLDDLVQAILQQVNGKRAAIDLPLDLRATAFQWRVWKALQRIPYGRRRSYSQLAASLGIPTAARAVARACATNPVSLVIPCHRLVREDGQAGGYRWGIDRKRRLLEHERKVLKGADGR